MQPLVDCRHFCNSLHWLIISPAGFAVNNSFQSDLEDAGRQFACPEEVVNYTCTVVDTNIPLAFTLWRGTTLFTCPGSQIILIHLSFSTSGASDSCNNGAITAESVGVEDNCFTSRLMVTVSPTLNETTIECTLAGVTIAGSDTLLIAGITVFHCDPLLYISKLKNKKTLAN